MRTIYRKVSPAKRRRRRSTASRYSASLGGFEAMLAKLSLASENLDRARSRRR